MRVRRHLVYTREELNCLDAIQRGDMTTWQAAESLGVTESTIFTWMRYLGIHSGVKAKRKREIQAALESIKRGEATVEQVAERLGTTPRTVRDELYESGYEERIGRRELYCKRCEILLSEALKGDNGICGWCATETARGFRDPRYYDALVVTESDTRERREGISCNLAIAERY